MKISLLEIYVSPLYSYLSSRFNSYLAYSMNICINSKATIPKSQFKKPYSSNHFWHQFAAVYCHLDPHISVQSYLGVEWTMFTISQLSNSFRHSQDLISQLLTMSSSECFVLIYFGRWTSFSCNNRSFTTVRKLISLRIKPVAKK